MTVSPSRKPARRRRALSSLSSLSSLAAALSLPLASSCVTYHDRVSGALRAFERGDFPSAVEQYSDTDKMGSAFLSGAESGMAALVAADFATAREQLGRAAEVIEEYEDSPPITPQTTAESAAALLLNEGAATYEGEGYERVQLHATLALTYLAAGDVAGVGVEARRANKLLENEEKLYDKQYRAGGLGHFVSALAYELQGSYDEAFIDYRRMQEKGVGTELAGRALVRTAKRLGYDDELAQLEQQYGAAVDVPADAASIVLIVGVGMGPRKIEKTLTLPLAHGVGQISVPEFMGVPQPVSAVELRVSGASAPLRSSSIEDVTLAATENLNDRIGWLTARSLLRGTLKYEATRRLSRQLGDGGNNGGALVGLIVGSIFTIATERADLRSWQTLPDTWQAARMFVAPGSHELALDAIGGESSRLGTFELAPGETLFIVARTLGTRLYAHAIGGQRTDAPASPITPPATPKTSNQP